MAIGALVMSTISHFCLWLTGFGMLWVVFVHVVMLAVLVGTCTSLSYWGLKERNDDQ